MRWNIFRQCKYAFIIYRNLQSFVLPLACTISYDYFYEHKTFSNVCILIIQQ